MLNGCGWSRTVSTTSACVFEGLGRPRLRSTDSVRTAAAVKALQWLAEKQLVLIARFSTKALKGMYRNKIIPRTQQDNNYSLYGTWLFVLDKNSYIFSAPGIITVTLRTASIRLEYWTGLSIFFKLVDFLF